MTTPASKLPQYRGHPVPWVTRWSGEVISDGVNVVVTREGPRVQYPDGQETRDDRGYLWKREGLTRAGQPQFSQVNAFRQRSAMLRRKCQICGSKIDERPIRWLMSPLHLNYVDADTAITLSPPTCSDCIPLALELCPHLQTQGYLILKVLEYEPWGVMGHGVTLSEEGLRDHREALVPFEGNNNPGAVIAYQLLVRLTKYVIEEQNDGAGEVAGEGADLGAQGVG